MSNKITLATIQFRADTKGVNPALDAMRQSSKDAHDEVDRLQEALDKGIKKMKDANGVEFDVADKFRQAQKAAKSYDQALRELVKGATALETVVQNIRLGEIEKSSRAELKGAINAAEARKRSVRETDPEDLQQQRELNQVIEESRKQLNNLDRDTQKVIETLDKGGVVAQATLDKEIKGLKEILTLIPKGTDEWNKYNQQLTQMEAHVASIRRQEREAAVSLLGSKDFGRYSEEEIRTAITNARELLSTYKTASPEAKALADNIVRADQYLKEHGIEAAKESAKQQQTIKQERQLHMLMNARLKDLTTLSADALEETRKYWQAQQDGAEASSYAFRKAKKSLQEINAEQDARNRKQLMQTAGRLKQQDLSTLSEDELNQAIKAGKELVALMKPADKGYQQLIDNIIRAEKHVKEFGLEGERSNRKTAEQMQIMVDRMARLSSLSDGALQETRKFWQEQMDGAERGSDAYKEAAKNLKAIADEQTRLTNEQNKTQATRLLNKGNLQTMSEGEIRKSIEAAKLYQQTLSTSDAMYQRLSVAIVDAEEHIKEYGIESERTARKEAAAQKLLDDKHRMMQDRMQNLQNLSEGGLAETKKYWQAQMDGAERSSRAFKEAEKNLKAINAEQQRLANDQMQKSARRLNRRDLSTMSEQELTESVKAAKQLLANMKPAETGFKQLQDNIIRAEKHIKEFGLESERSLKAAEEQTRLMNSRMKSLKTLSADALEETRKYWQAQRDGADAGSKEFEKAEKNLKRIDNLIGKRKVMALDEILGDPQHHGVSEVEQAVKEMEQLRDSVQKGVPAWQHYNKMVNQGRDYLDQLAKTEAADRVAAQMKNLSQLSKAGLDEVKRYWQAQIDGATRGSQAYADAEAAMKRITNLEQTRQAGQATRVLYRPDRYGDAEIRQAIQAMEQLRDAQAHGSQKWEMYNKRVQEGKQYLEEWAQLDNVIKFEGQMQKLPQLSDAALAETKKFWETMVVGAEKGSQELAQYEAHLERVKQEERERRQLNDEITAQRLNGNLKTQSEQEIREAIEAAKRLIQTYESAGPEAAALSVKIADAEEHLKKYGLEAERAARREAKAIADAAQKRQESDDLMKQQLQQGASLSKEALKAQEQYWKKLIDDPKTAAASLQGYQQQLDKVRMLQELMMQQRGTDALDRMRNDVDYERKVSPNQIKEDIEAIKALRNSLPQEGNEDVLREIDYYLTQLEGSAKKATQEVMSLDDALELAKKAGDWEGDGFFATPQSIQAATKAIEKQRDSVIQLIQQKRNLGQATKAEEDQLADLTKKLRSLKFEQDNVNMSQEKMRTLIETPANAVNLDELRAAIKRADGQLRQMQQSLGKNSDEYKRFAEQVRQAKNVMKEMEGQAKASATAWEKAFSRLKTYVVMYMGFNEVWQKVSNTARDLMDLSDRMGEVRKTTGFTADEVGRLSENLKKMDVRTSLTSLMEISASAGQLGLKTLEDVQGFTEAANKLMIALPEMGREAATEMMRVAIATGEVDKIRKQLQEGTIEGSSATAVAMEKIASTIDRLRASSASTAPEITDFVKRVGAVGAQSGITIDQVAALGSTVSSLGMRIEMSATALSRMIPAIRNNAFELAKAIGVTPDTVRNLFDTGRGMEVILMILQRIKDTGMDADSVEQMLGMAGMRDIMKDLNQQGARAGIVFSGLSQNVDELRRQLGVAGEAYEENIAIQQEFDKMNETTAAKWERLKNAFEEAFVSDKAQRFLGTVIDGLRKIVDLLMGGGGLTTALATISTLVLVLKTNIIGIMWSAIALGLTKIIDLFKNWRIALDLVILKLRALTLAQWANVFVAAASAVAMLVYSLRNAANAMSETSKAMGEVEKQLYKQMTAADKLFRSLAKVREQERVAALAAKEQAKAETEKGKAAEQSADKTDKLSKETDKLAGSEKKAAEQTAKVEEGMKRVNTEGKESARIIREINSKYGAYLGYMLSETASAKQLAEARELINKKLRETITLKQKEAALSDIEQEYGGKVRKGASSTDDLIASYFGSNDEAYARVSVAVSEAAQKYAKDQKKFQAEVQKIVMANRQFISQSAKKDFRDAYAQSGRGASDNEIVSSIASNIGARAESYRASVEEYQKQVETAERVFDARSNVLRKESRESAMRTLNSIMADWKDALARYQKAEGEEKEKLAVEVYKQQRSYNNLFANNADYFTNDKRKGTIERSIENMKSYEKGLRQVADESIRAVDAAERAESKIQNTDFTNGNEGSGNSPWGTSERADSTTYTEMTAEQLVNRREQMNKFVNSLQTDTDVKAVLNEDKALKKAIEAGMSSDMRTVIEWYNTERLKIQDELHARHLTNTGDWLDPKKERGAKKQFRDEMDAYLHELDAYYTERKTRIEEAGTDEGLTEAEIHNRTLANEMEWQQRRAELQKLYSRKQKEVTQEELEAIYHIISERTGDTESFVKAQIAKTNQFVDAIEKSGDKGAAIVHRWMSQVELDTERSYLKGQQALTKQMKAIEDIIDKERPFNGITKQLRESLATMDILTGDMRKEYDELMKAGKDMRDFNERQGREELRRTTFLLGEAEQAYSTTIDRVMQQMREKGMTAWADWLSIRPEQQEALMAQLRQTYDAIQDAIKKEASQLKKQAEIMWNNILVPGGDGKTTMKQMLDRTVAQLGIDQGRVSRANSLIGAGVASDRVADKLAIQQMRLQLTMQEHYYNLMKKQGRAHVDMLNQQAEAAKKRGDAEEATRKTLDAQHAEMALNLATAKEETELAKQREEIIARTEESQNRLYTELRSWADLLTSSLQGVFEASHAGDAEYYNERAKLDLTGKGGPGAGTYVVIDDAGTSDATAHYEYLDERQALERQHEIEIQNAQAEAWRKLMDDLNMKMNEQITDWINAAAQNASVDANTDATLANTEAIVGLTAAMGGKVDTSLASGLGYEPSGNEPNPTIERIGYEAEQQVTQTSTTESAPSVFLDPNNVGLPWEQQAEAAELSAERQVGAIDKVKTALDSQFHRQEKGSKESSQKMTSSTQSAFAKMTQAANMYGIAYQVMQNDNLSASQKFGLMAVQAAGQAAITSLTVDFASTTAQTASDTPSVLSKLYKQLGWGAIPVFAVFTGLLGGLLGLAASKIAKSKSEIAQATGASVSAGRLATGMLTYAEGNVNELTDPASLTPGRQYNVDGADGKTYRARYMGKGAKTHITNGPEFHLVGEAGREAIIDAKTTRLLQMNETGIWRDIQTLYNGGSISGLSTRRRRGNGMPAFADGNIGEFEDMADGGGLTAEGTGGMSAEVMTSMLETNSRLADLLENALVNGIKAVNKWTGSDGIPAMYNKLQKEAQRHGEKYL